MPNLIIVLFYKGSTNRGNQWPCKSEGWGSGRGWSHL